MANFNHITQSKTKGITMKNLMLIFASIFLCTGVFANTKCIQSNQINFYDVQVAINLTIDQVQNMSISELEKLITNMTSAYDNECTVTVRVSGTIEVKGIGSVTVEVEVTGSCEEAGRIARDVLKAVTALLE